MLEHSIKSKFSLTDAYSEPCQTLYEPGQRVSFSGKVQEIFSFEEISFFRHV